jgi:hypothetical protein
LQTASARSRKSMYLASGHSGTPISGITSKGSLSIFFPLREDVPRSADYDLDRDFLQKIFWRTELGVLQSPDFYKKF